MFIRKVKKQIKTDGKNYNYFQHRLVESVRTQRGPRQQTVLNLGTLEIEESKFKSLANSIEAVLNKQNLLLDDDPEISGLAQHFAQIIIRKRLQEQKLLSQQAKEEAVSEHFETIDVNSVTSSEGRSVGLEHIVISNLKKLGFFKILEECDFSKDQINHAAAQLCSRIVHPDSERESARWLRENSATDELLGADFSNISDNTLHRIADKLLENKNFIEQKLADNTRDLFSLNDTFIFYDLTNTYFESPKRASSIAKYGKSKEKRNDCPIVTLALVVDEFGFPKKSQIYEGNAGEAETLFDILEQMVSDGDRSTTPKTVIMDAGIATEENIERLKADSRFEYVAVSRKRLPQELFDNSDVKEIEVNRKKKLTVKTINQDDETFLLCFSEERAAKEDAIFSNKKTKFEKELLKLQEGLSRPGTVKKYDKILERIGRLKERYKMGNFFKIEVIEKDKIVTGIKWSFLKDKTKEPGEYILRTSRTDLLDEQISMLHRTLTMIESSFRWMKMELGMRPNYHQKDSRMESHIFISVLAYFVLAPILNKLDWGGRFIGTKKEKKEKQNWDIPFGLKMLAGTMQSQSRVTTSFKCKDKKRMDIRTTMEPTANQIDVYRRLDISSRPLKRVIIKT